MMNLGTEDCEGNYHLMFFPHISYYDRIKKKIKARKKIKVKEGLTKT